MPQIIPLPSSPDVFSLVLFGVEEAIKLEPAVETALRGIFSKADVTPADWAAARASLKPYEAYAPDPDAPAATPESALPAGTQPQTQALIEADAPTVTAATAAEPPIHRLMNL